MLCRKCEIKFSKYESIAGPFLNLVNQFQQESTTSNIPLFSLDYHNLKLFFMSILWRCAACRDPITQKVRLGARFQYLGNLLRIDDPGKEFEFAIFLRVLDVSIQSKNAVLTVPVPMRDGDRRGYAMVGNGVEITWITDKRGVSLDSARWILREDGSWIIEVIPGSKCFPWVKAISMAHQQDHDRLSKGKS